MEVNACWIWLYWIITNNYITLKSCDIKRGHQKFNPTLIQNLLKMSLNLNPAQEEDQTHKPIKLHILNLNIWNTGQLWDCVYGAVCVLYDEVVWIQNFNVKVQSQLVYRPVFSHFPYGCQFLNQSVLCYNMGGTFTDNCMHCKVWFIYLVCPINL
jgi:hypothetical protein